MNSVFVMCALLTWTVTANEMYYAINQFTNPAKVDKPFATEDEWYDSDWDFLDDRPLPEWYDSAKIGIFVHWGVYSVPGYKSEWFWSSWKNGDAEIQDYMNKNYAPNFTNQDFAPMFKGEFFDPKNWVQLFKDAGARYVVLTSKHHDGFTLFPSERSYSWNSVDAGPHRDIVREISKATKAAGMQFGLYYSLYEWNNPMYRSDKLSGFKDHLYVDYKVLPELKQLIRDYRPAVLWSDGDWEARDSYWKSQEFLSWLYNKSPVKTFVVTNDRWGNGTACTHGDFYNCGDRYHPETLQSYKWENAFTLDTLSWGYVRNLKLGNVMTTEELIHTVVSTVSCGGNALINVGATSEGTIDPIFQERLLSLGRWLSLNGEAIYGTSPWHLQKESCNKSVGGCVPVWYTCTKAVYNALDPTAKPENSDNVTAVYAIFLQWPKNDILLLKDISPYLSEHQVELLYNKKKYLRWVKRDNTIKIKLPSIATVPCNYAWTLKFTKIVNKPKFFDGSFQR